MWKVKGKGKEVLEIYEDFYGNLWFITEKHLDYNYGYARLYNMPQFAEWGSIPSLQQLRGEIGEDKVWKVEKQNWGNINSYEEGLLINEEDKPSENKEDLTRLPLKEIATRLRKEFKDEFPNCVFSVVTEYYSMGQTLHVSLIKADRKILLKQEDIPQDLVLKEEAYGRKINIIPTKCHSLNRYQFKNKPEFNCYWNNGLWLTKEGNELLAKVYELINKYNYDRSEPMTDYYDVHFSLDMHLGKYDKPFEEVIA